MFGNRKQAMNFDGYPALLREIAEFYEHGELSELKIIDFVHTIE